MSLDEAIQAAVLDQSSDPLPGPSQIPPQPPRGRSLFFSGSQPETWETPAAPEEEAASQPAAGDGSASDDEWPSDPDESPTEISGSASSADGPLKPLGKA